MATKPKEKIKVFDSHTGEEFPGHRLYAVSYEPFWQVVRITCDFASDSKIRNSFATLEVYVSGATTEKESQLRLYRVYNMLNAIPIGQSNKMGIQHISRGEASLIIPARASFGERLHAVGYPKEWDWHTTRQNLDAIWKRDPEKIEAIHTDLLGRMAKPGKPELRYYLKLVEEITDDLS